MATVRANMDDEYLESQAEMMRAVAQLVRESVSQAYEEAYPLICGHCADGLPITQDSGGHYIHIVPVAMFVGPDYEETQSADMPQGCRAQQLRALKDSLQPETASATSSTS
jgi:hypothetical protein